MKHVELFFAIASISLLASLSCAAEDQKAGAPSEHPHEHGGATHPVPEIIVTADPLGQVDGHFLTPTTILDGDDLRRQSMRSIGDAVANQPGVSAADFGTGVGRPVIRGIGGARVRVLENGIGTLDLSAISADHGVSSEPIFAEQIEILRGPATLLYGSGASGGLVNVVDTRIAKQLPSATEADLYNHYDTVSDGWLGAVRASGAVGDHIALYFDALRRHTDDIDIPGTASRTPEVGDVRGRLQNSDAETDRLSAGASWIGERGHLGFNLSTMSNNYGVPGAHGHEEEEHHDEDDDDDHEEDEDHDDELDHAEDDESGTRIDVLQRRYDIDGAYDLELGLVHSLKTHWVYNDYEHDEIESDGGLGTRFHNNEWEGRVEVLFEPIGVFDGMFGMQFRDKSFSAVGEEAFVPPAELDSFAFFVFEKAEFGDLHVDFGLRYENQDASVNDSQLEASHDLFSASAGAIFNYHPTREIGITGGISQRAPQIEELFAFGPHLATNTFEIGDSSLNRETSNSIDVFWRGAAGPIEFDATMFYNRISNYIYLASQDLNRDGIADRVEEDATGPAMIVDELDALLVVRQTQSDARFWGFEFAATALLLDNQHGRLSGRAWTDYVDGHLDSGDSVPRLTPFRLGWELNYERGPVNFDVNITHVTSADDIAPLETDTDAYTLVGLQLSWSGKVSALRDVELFARASNLLNAEARRHTSFVKDLASLPGRSGLFGMRLKF